MKQNPQEKAQSEAESAANAAGNAAGNATVDANKADAAVEKAESLIYSDVAAANTAASKVVFPTLKGETKTLAKGLGDLIVKRINAKTDEEATKLDTDITNERAKITQKATDKKICSEDEATILKYGDDIIAAAKAAVGL